MFGRARSDRFGISGSEIMMLREYEVLYVEREKNTVYICRRPPESRLYRVIETADRTLIGKYIKYFVTFKPREFYEDFCLNEKYYVVFRAPDGVPLKKSDGILTARKVVRALALQNPPLEIAANILSCDHIFMCGNELEFAYDLPETDIKITREYFFVKLTDFVNSFLETETDRNTDKWLADLRGGRFEDLLTAYRCMPDAAEETDLPKRGRFEKIKAVLPKIAVAAVAIAAIITAVIAFDKSGGEETDHSRIDSLGTIDLTKQ